MQQAIYFSPAISLARAVISSINAHHTRLVKLFSFNFVCPKIILREYFFYENLLDEIKANYGMCVYSSYDFPLFSCDGLPPYVFFLWFTSLCMYVHTCHTCSSDGLTPYVCTYIHVIHVAVMVCLLRMYVHTCHTCSSDGLPPYVCTYIHVIHVAVMVCLLTYVRTYMYTCIQ